MLIQVRRHAAEVACAAACAWAVLVASAPWLAARAAGSGPALALSAATYVAGSVLCHQRPARSFHAAAAQLPVCARCTGLYLSAAVGGLVALAVLPWLRTKGAHWRAVLLLAALPLCASVALEWTGLWAGSNLARALTAVPAGAAAGAMMVESLSFRGKL